MSNTLTVISHIFNEEYLLPFWLEHHKQIFDHGVIIDYCSTDRSVEIIKKYCPTWEIIKTQNLNENGTPNFEAILVDLEVNNVEERINGYKICLNTTEFLLITKSKDELINYLSKNVYYYINIHNVMADKKNFFPRNAIDFFKEIELIGYATKTMKRGHRILHSDLKLNYCHGRHWHYAENPEKIIYNSELFFILWTKFYPFNNKTFERKLQIQKNITRDFDAGMGLQHRTNFQALIRDYKNDLKNHVIKIDNYSNHIKNCIDRTCEKLKQNNIYYSELIVDSNWGKNFVMLKNDNNLLKYTDFDNIGYKILDIKNCNNLLQRIIKNEIKLITNKEIKLENYHNEITEEQHQRILNSMPYKKNMNPDVEEFASYLEKLISEILNEPIKIFNNDLWVRVCRPCIISDNDYNPCHRDVYLDFYRNVVNIYLPIVGSNENSSLTIQPYSHKWSENETMVTQGGAFFKSQNKKYLVDAIAASIKPLEMIRPNPKENQLMLFSPYLIQCCANNNNKDATRISLEVRFIRNDENGLKQEAEINEFLKIRNWR